MACSRTETESLFFDLSTLGSVLTGCCDPEVSLIWDDVREDLIDWWRPLFGDDSVHSEERLGCSLSLCADGGMVADFDEWSGLQREMVVEPALLIARCLLNCECGTRGTGWNPSLVADDVDSTQTWRVGGLSLSL